ncbi:hypothetical protein BLNAU_7334 [Blattamonas nauphoetae]|uniref:Uncharacterized protein n=1 Tax=Blattamonas nauphoetae TaxID=2049346 RepID=A0ABQ9Y1V4_9EUKA|nr:hypothetical protein BLNAU_7334 [Blattamonas nauphoetae]
MTLPEQTNFQLLDLHSHRQRYPHPSAPLDSHRCHLQKPRLEHQVSPQIQPTPVSVKHHQSLQHSQLRNHHLSTPKIRPFQQSLLRQTRISLRGCHLLPHTPLKTLHHSPPSHIQGSRPRAACTTAKRQPTLLSRRLIHRTKAQLAAIRLVLHDHSQRTLINQHLTCSRIPKSRNPFNSLLVTQAVFPAMDHHP